VRALRLFLRAGPNQRAARMDSVTSQCVLPALLVTEGQERKKKHI